MLPEELREYEVQMWEDWMAGGGQGDSFVFRQGGRTMYVLGNVNFRATPSYPDGRIITGLTPGDRVTWTGRTCTSDGIIWYQVIDSRGRIGWVSAKYLDPLALPHQVIPAAGGFAGYTMQMGTRSDGKSFVYYVGSDELVVSIVGITQGTARQYLYYDGGLKTNLCGAFCAAYLAGVSIDRSFFDLWQAQQPGDYAVAVTGNHPYGIEVVERLLDMYHLGHERFDSQSVLSPSQLKAEIDSGKKLIAGVGINGSGVLAAGNIGHWVVVRDVTMNNDGIWIHIYNPFMNRYEIYDFETFQYAFSHGGTGYYNGTWVI